MRGWCDRKRIKSGRMDRRMPLNNIRTRRLCSPYTVGLVTVVYIDRTDVVQSDHPIGDVSAPIRCNSASATESTGLVNDAKDRAHGKGSPWLSSIQLAVQWTVNQCQKTHKFRILLDIIVCSTAPTGLLLRMLCRRSILYGVSSLHQYQSVSLYIFVTVCCFKTNIS